MDTSLLCQGWFYTDWFYAFLWTFTHHYYEPGHVWSFHFGANSSEKTKFTWHESDFIIICHIYIILWNGTSFASRAFNYPGGRTRCPVFQRERLVFSSFTPGRQVWFLSGQDWCSLSVKKSPRKRNGPGWNCYGNRPGVLQMPWNV